jgi:hypothetical protein
MSTRATSALLTAGLTLGASLAEAKPGTVRLVRVREPRQGAFSLLMPVGWQLSGGMFWVHPEQAGGTANSIETKCDLTVAADPAGTVALRVYPDVYRADTAKMPAGAMFPYGSNYNGMEAAPVPSAADYIVRGLQAVRPKATELRVVRADPMSAVAAAHARHAAQVTPMLRPRFDAALVTVEYTEGGVRYREQAFTVIEDRGAMVGGQWANRQTLSARAPVDRYAAWAPIFGLMIRSIQLDPRWLRQELVAQAERAGVARQVQADVARLEREITQHRAETNAEINNDGFLTLTGQEEFVNPYDGETIVSTDAYRHQWINGSGELILSDDADYDPNLDEGVKRSDFRRMKVRPRGPR